MCQGFSNLSGFSHHFELAKLVASSITVKNIGFSKALSFMLQRSGQKIFPLFPAILNIPSTAVCWYGQIVPNWDMGFQRWLDMSPD